jgi:hypothetical protein
MKKITSILILLIILLNLPLVMINHYIEKQSIRKDVKLYLLSNPPLNKLEKLEIHKDIIKSSNSLFQWIHKHEFRYMGKMYDIFKQERNGDNYIFYCINDKKEEALFEKFSDYLDGSGFTANLKSNIIRNLSGMFFALFYEKMQLNLYPPYLKNINTNKIIHFLSFIFDIDPPPPKNI